MHPHLAFNLSFRLFRHALPGILLLLALSLNAAPAAAGKDKKEREKEADAFFSSTNIISIQINIAPENVAVLRKYRFQWEGRGEGAGGKSERTAVLCTVREGDKVYTNVSVHMKGAAGSFRSIDQNPCLTLNFDKQVPGQKFHGLDKISLNNSVQDPTYVMEKVSREFFHAAGVPVPRADHIQLTLNGRELGLYGIVEGFNKQFLKRYFTNSSGNLYDGGFIKDVTDDLALNSGDNPDKSALKALAEAAAEPNLTNRFQRLEKLLDMDRFLSFLAMEVMLWDWDGYAMNRNNFRIYHEPDANKIIFMPHGKDQMFWVPIGPILPPMKGLVAKALVQTPEGRKRYLEKVGQLATNLFSAETLTNRVQSLGAKVRPLLAAKNPQAVKTHEREIASICEQIVTRVKSINEQLAAPSRALKFDDSGLAQLGNWKSKGDFGKPVFEEKKENGKALMRISAEQGSCVGSWRTKVFLEPGQYRVEAKVKTQGVATDPGDSKGGVGLRIGSRRFNQKLVGNSDWAPATFEFEVTESSGDVEILCEMRAAKGEAWFDTSSIKLVRK